MKVHFIEFEGRSFPLVEADDGQFYVSVRPICDAIGVRWVGQHRKLYRGDCYRSASFRLASLNALEPTVCIPAMRVFGWLRSFYQGRAKDPETQQNAARYFSEFVDVLDEFIKQMRTGAPPETAPVNEKDWRIEAIEARLDKIERRLRRGEGER